MKKIFLFLLAMGKLLVLHAQVQQGTQRIDFMLMHGDFHRVVDTCSRILATDSMNAAVYYRLGLAYQNIMPDDKSFGCFLEASHAEPGNSFYRYLVAKGYYDKGKNARAKPLFSELFSSDSLNWSYAFYHTAILMNEKKYDDCISIYGKFLEKEPGNTIYLDKLGYAYLKKGSYEKAVSFYEKSLGMNEKNINAMKNLSYLYPFVHKTDTALALLTRAIQIDPDDNDLYARRATINFSKNYTKRALNDYLRILSTGDTTALYLKRSGIGYYNNFEPEPAIEYLKLAYHRDTTDYESLTYLAKCYEKLQNNKMTIVYYKKIIDLLEPLSIQLGEAHLMLADVYKKDNQFSMSIQAYEKAQNYIKDPALTLMIANVYDEKLNNIPKALGYYKKFTDAIRSNEIYTRLYLESVKKRVAYLEEQQKITKKP